MSEKSSQERPPRKLKLAAEIGGAGLGVAGVSTAAYLLWRRQREEAQTYKDVIRSPIVIFEEGRLPLTLREAMANIAVRVHHASTSSGNGVIGRVMLREQLELGREDFNKAMGYLKPQKGRPRDEAYIDRRPGVLDGKMGYYGTNRLTELIESDDIDILVQASNTLFNDNS